MGYSIELVRRSMPNIGDHKHGGIVDYVHRDNLWYRIKKPDGTTESFKLPNSESKTMYYNELRMARKLFNVKTPGVRCPCRVVETKKEYASFAECSKDIGCSPWTVKNAADIGRKVLGKYTIERLK